MHLGRIPLATAVAVVAGALATTGLGTPTAHAATTSAVSLPLTQFSHMLVANQHIFYSGGTGSTGILVTDLDGGNATTIAGEDGATEMVASPDGSTVYAALGDAHAIAAISTATLTETARYTTPDTVEPQTVTTTGSTLWFGYNGSTGVPSGIGSVDLTTTPATVGLTSMLLARGWSSAPELAASPTVPGRLVAAQRDLSPVEMATFDVSTPADTRLVDTFQMKLYGTDQMAPTPDGNDVVVSGPGGVQVFHAADLTADGVYDSDSGESLAVAPDGTVIAAASSTDGDVTFPVSTYAPGSSRALTTYGLTGGAVVGVGWANDGSEAFAVARAGAGYTLDVLAAPETADTALSLTGPAQTVDGQQVQLTGTLDSGRALPAGTTVHVRRSSGGGAPTPLPDVTTDAAGHFTVTDAPTASGTNTYTVSYGGDGTHRPSTAQFQVLGTTYPSTLSLTAPTTATRGAAVQLTGKLTSSALPAGTVVAITRTDLASPNGLALGTAQVAADGTFSFKDAPPAGGSVTYRVNYAGDVAHDLASAQAAAQVSRAATALTVATDTGVYTYGAWAKVTVHLGTTFNGRTVTVLAKAGNGVTTVLRTGAVDSSGNLVAYAKLAYNTTFTASFAGDYRYAPASASKRVYTHVAVAESQSGFYASGTLSGTAVKYFHHTAHPTLTATVAPDKAGECARFTLQEYYSGAWHALTTSGCFALSASSSQKGVVSLGSNSTNHLFRYAAEYVNGTDATDLATWGAWQYFYVKY